MSNNFVYTCVYRQSRSKGYIEVNYLCERGPGYNENSFSLLVGHANKPILLNDIAFSDGLRIVS